jgi:3D-(3,5/4)-trihydroxycyclohexane-1,2-dione acylhydrolase (decyclizing)
LLRASRRPLLVLGGGVRYSGATRVALAFAERHGVPVTETTAGRTLVPHDHPLYAGPLGITGSSSANALAADADLVLAVGTRLQDFTTASWSVFAPDVRLVSINTARFDAVKHGGLAVVGDARETLDELSVDPWPVDKHWTTRAHVERSRWDDYISGLRTPGDGLPTYAQVVGVVNDAAERGDYVMTASGGLPGELIGGWRATSPGMDVEYGFSCMGYELAGAWGAAITHTDGVVTTLLGDGSYLMLNSELYSAAFAGHGFVAVVCDNDGYAVIDRLQRGNGGSAFNNMYADCRSPHAQPPRVDFASHAAALGCAVLAVDKLDGLAAAYAQARTHARAGTPAVVVIRTHPSSWTDAGAWWEVGVPEVSTRAEITEARTEADKAKGGQVRYLTRP